jgi:hypothetical protein
LFALVFRPVDRNQQPLPFAAFGGGMLFFDRRKNRRSAMMA